MGKEYIDKPMQEIDPTHELKGFFGPHHYSLKEQEAWIAKAEKNNQTIALTPNKQVGGTHYQKAIQPWDYIISNNLGFLEGNIIKYVTRYKDKNGIEDLKKARHYLEKLMEGMGGA